MSWSPMVHLPPKVLWNFGHIWPSWHFSFLPPWNKNKFNTINSMYLWKHKWYTSYYLMAFIASISSFLPLLQLCQWNTLWYGIVIPWCSFNFFTNSFAPTVASTMRKSFTFSHIQNFVAFFTFFDSLWLEHLWSRGLLFTCTNTNN